MAKSKTCKRELRRTDRGRLIVRGPVELAGKIVSNCATMIKPEFVGHDVEGSVRIKGKRYSAFTSGGVHDFVIVARDERGSIRRWRQRNLSGSMKQYMIDGEAALRRLKNKKQR